MTLLDRLENKYRRFAIPNITLYLIVGQVFFYAGIMTDLISRSELMLVPASVLKGQVWQLFSFIFVPPCSNPLFAFFAWYLLYLMGTALENQWGTFRYNLFLIIGYIATIGFAFLTPEFPATNKFVGGSVYLAFAFLYPEFVLYLFFILPIRIKWLALVTWIGYFLVFAFGDWSDRFMVLASVCNFLLFFWRDIFSRIRYGRIKMVEQAAWFAVKDAPMHRCAVCGATDKSRPGLEFRYCGDCKPVTCYCIDHLPGHQHIQPQNLRPGG